MNRRKTATEKPLLVDWPLDLETTRVQLSQARVELERSKASLDLARKEIEQRNRVIRSLTAFSYQASRATAPAALLRLSLARALETAHCEIGAITLIDKEGSALSLGAHKNLPPPLAKILTGQQLDNAAAILMPHLVAGRGILLEADAANDDDEHLLLRTGQVTSLVSLPLQAGPQLLGALVVGSRSKENFSPADLYFLIALSQETAVALESLRLRENLWRMAEILLSGRKADETNLSALALRPPSVAISPLHAKLATIATNLSGTMGALFALVNSDAGVQGTLIAGYGLSPIFTNTITNFSLSEELLPYELLVQPCTVVENIPQTAMAKSAFILSKLQEEGATSLVAARFRSSQSKAWLMIVAADEPGKLTGSHAEQLLAAGKSLSPLLNETSVVTKSSSSPEGAVNTLASRTSEESLEKALVAVMDAQYEKEDLDADATPLDTITGIFDRSSNMEAILDKITSQARDILNADAAWLYLSDDPFSPEISDQGLTLRAHSGLSTRYMVGMRQLAFGKHLEGVVAREKKPLAINDVATCEIRLHLLVEQEDIQALMLVPVIVAEKKPAEGVTDDAAEQRVIGVLGVAKRQVYTWQAAEIGQLTRMVQEAIKTVRNAVLFAQVKEEIIKLSASNQILQEVNSDLIFRHAELESMLSELKGEQPESSPGRTEVHPPEGESD